MRFAFVAQADDNHYAQMMMTHTYIPAGQQGRTRRADIKMPKNGIFQGTNEIFQKIVKAIRIKRFSITALAENMFVESTASSAAILITSITKL